MTRAGRLTSIAYKTERCSGDREVGAYFLLGSGDMLAKVWNYFCARYCLDLLPVFSRNHSARPQELRIRSNARGRSSEDTTCEISFWLFIL